ncbi:MAG: VWA domain-containing protein [Armatimonadetes bacterium]|nr:VWA domain-containing protein [Armatimonadota bacterium]
MLEFVRPLYLLLLIPLVYYTYRVSRMSLADMSRFRSRLALGLRLLILTALILGLAGARIVRNTTAQCVVFALDVSDSIPKTRQDKALQWINSALKHMKPNQKAGLVVFGGDASVELAPSTVSKVEKIYSVPNTNTTDISQALGLALASFPQDCAKKIVLFSDGNETTGKAIEQAMLAGSNDVSVDVVPVASELPREVLLDKMVSPNSVKVGEPFDLKIVAVSKSASIARISVLRNGAPAGAKTVELAGGKNVLTFPQSITKPGNYEFQAILECDADTRPENNSALAYTMVKGRPKVLYVEGQPGQEVYLASALKASDIEVETRGRSGVPTSLAQLRGYDMIVLSDVPAWNLSPEQMEMIRSGVKDLGIGLTMVGGENSFGAGGYYDTPIEQALPVEMSIKKSRALPSVSVVIVMDKSGSMAAPEGGKTKIQLANDAAAAVVKLLQPIDRVGIIVCHSNPVVAVRLQYASNKSPIYRQISTIRAEGGGIAVFPSMVMANEIISGSNTRLKHVILLADGADCDEQEGVAPLVKQMAGRKITVTAVAIGDGPHVPFLKSVAYHGRGGFYLARQARDLKAIFTKDVMTVSKSLVVEEPFVPRADTSSRELSGIDASTIPPLLGYIATGPKSTASMLMVSHKNDPVLASWQYGLGRSAAFTSDCKARWSSRWITWPGYNRFWAQALRSTMRRSAPGEFQTAVSAEGGAGRVVIDAVDEKGDFLNLLQFSGSVIGPDAESRPISIEQTGPGRYEAGFDAREVGTYVVTTGLKDRADTAPEVSVVTIPYPPEYKDLAPDTQLLKRLASETSGKFAPQPSEVFTRNFRESKTYTDIWRLLVLIAAFALPLDVAVRRVAVTPEMLAQLRLLLRPLMGMGLGKRPGLAGEEEREETVGALLRSKKERSASSDDVEPPVPVRASEPAAPRAEQAPSPVPSSRQADKPAEKEVDGQNTTSRLLEAKKRARKQ